jgi:hypothetical protein
MKARPAGAGPVLVAVLAAALAGCRSEIRVTPPAAPLENVPPAATSAAVTRLGYTVQVGAFSVLDNARRLARGLNDLGLDAYYYPQGSGLYRVRFGDYATRSEAVREAEGLVEKGLVKEYFIVRPSARPAIGPDRPAAGLREKLAATAASFLGVDYSWGGASRSDGVDCSGLVRAVYRLNGLDLPRSTAGQFQAGATVPRDRLRKGDLVFFSASPGRRVSHVGIYVRDDVFIHAPGTGKTVREESLDSHYFRERFLGGRAYLD